MFKFLIYLLLSISLGSSFTKPNYDGATLKDTKGWICDTISTGFIWYQYSGYYAPHSAHHVVNIIEVDLNSSQYSIELSYVCTPDSLSSIAYKSGAIAGVNGTYETDASFIKSFGNVHSQVTLSPGHLRYWKHQGALLFNGEGQNATIAFGTNQSYLSSSFENILSGSPMLISAYDPVGESFVGDITETNLDTLKYEDFRRHQGVRHPRTAVAITGSRKLLLITVDGRRAGITDGMTARELTNFIAVYFNPKDALNIDGGGSTAMWIKERNISGTGVVNFPTDNRRFDHYGQRRVSSFILIKERSSNY